jgi:hypothetical protein
MHRKHISSYLNPNALTESGIRVTKLGEFLPIGQWFTLGSFLCRRVVEVVQIFVQTRYNKTNELLMTNNGLGYFLGDFHNLIWSP